MWVLARTCQGGALLSSWVVLSALGCGFEMGLWDFIPRSCLGHGLWNFEFLASFFAALGVSFGPRPCFCDVECRHQLNAFHAAWPCGLCLGELECIALHFFFPKNPPGFKLVVRMAQQPQVRGFIGAVAGDRDNMVDLQSIPTGAALFGDGVDIGAPAFVSNPDELPCRRRNMLASAVAL